MAAAALPELRRESQDAKEKVFLFSHLKATMMKVSDPIMLGHCVKLHLKATMMKVSDPIMLCRVKAYFKDVFESQGLRPFVMEANEYHVENRAVLEVINWCSGARILRAVSGLSPGCRPRWPGALGVGFSPATVSLRPLGAL